MAPVGRQSGTTGGAGRVVLVTEPEGRCRQNVRIMRSFADFLIDFIIEEAKFG